MEISRAESQLSWGKPGCFRDHKTELLFQERENVWSSQWLPLKILQISLESKTGQAICIFTKRRK